MCVRRDRLGALGMRQHIEAIEAILGGVAHVRDGGVAIQFIDRSDTQNRTRFALCAEDVRALLTKLQQAVELPEGN